MSDAVRLCDTLINEGLAMTEKSGSYDNAAIHLVKLKKLNRHYYTMLDKQRSTVDSFKEKVDKKRLHLENLLYEVDHWQREIRIAKDLTVPQLTKLNKDMNNINSEQEITKNSQFCTYDNSNIPLEQQHESYLQTIELEKKSREALMQELSVKQALQYKLSERLEKKRRFLDELPAKVSTLTIVASSIQVMIDQVNDTSNSSNTMSTCPSPVQEETINEDV